jgi:hypothetical protein
MANVTPFQPPLRDLFSRSANPALKCRAMVGRPFGTRRAATSFPALKRRAIFECPYGTNGRRDSIPQIPRVVFDAVLFEQGQELLLKRHFAMVFFLSRM